MNCHPIANEQESAAARRTLCATLMIDAAADDMTRRIGNKVYDMCRSSTLDLQGFPNFQPLIDALREGVNEEPPKDFQVCRQLGSALYVLEVYARKFMDHEGTRDRATALLAEHNAQFNKEAPEFLQPDEAQSLVPNGNLNPFNSGCFFDSMLKLVVPSSKPGNASQGRLPLLQRNGLSSGSRLNLVTPSRNRRCPL